MCVCVCVHDRTALTFAIFDNDISPSFLSIIFLVKKINMREILPQSGYCEASPKQLEIEHVKTPNKGNFGFENYRKKLIF